MTPLLFVSKVFLCSGLLFTYYLVFLRNKKFHHYNRFYLVASIMLSVIIPFFSVPVTNHPTVYKAIDIISVNNFEKDVFAPIFSSANFFTTKQVLYAVYCCGSIIMLILLVSSIFYIRKLSGKYVREQIGDIAFYNTVEPGTPFSFFKLIFWNKKIDASSNEGQQIFRHEMFHVRQLHSADILFTQIISIIFWFNPFFHLIKKELKAIHEFLADEYAFSGNDRYSYAELLLLESMRSKRFLANPFFGNDIKRRIHMITKLNSRYGYGSRLMVLPLAVFLISLFVLKAQKQHVQKVNEVQLPKTGNIISVFTDTIPKVRKIDRDELKNVEVHDNKVVIKLQNGDSIVSYGINPNNNDLRNMQLKFEEMKKAQLDEMNEKMRNLRENKEREKMMEMEKLKDLKEHSDREMLEMKKRYVEDAVGSKDAGLENDRNMQSELAMKQNLLVMKQNLLREEQEKRINQLIEIQKVQAELRMKENQIMQELQQREAEQRIQSKEEQMEKMKQQLEERRKQEEDLREQIKRLKRSRSTQ